MDVIDHDQIIFWKYTEYSINNPVSDFCCVFHPNNEKKRWRQEMEKSSDNNRADGNRYVCTERNKRQCRRYEVLLSLRRRL